MLYNVAETVEFMVIDTSTGKGKTGDNANLTLRWVKDGTSAALSGAPASSEIDATNCPGLYKVTVAAADTQCLSGTLHGKSSTANIEIVPRYFEVLPSGASSNSVNGTLLSTGLDNVKPAEPANVGSFGTITLPGMISWMYAVSTNKKTMTSTTKTLRNRADNASIATGAPSDDGTTLNAAAWT